MLREHAVEDFGCDEDCAHHCANTDFFSCPADMVACMSSCTCTTSVVSIATRSDFNYSSLLKYSGYNKQAWSYFMVKKNKY